MAYKTVKIVKGSGGWGGPILVTASEEKKIVASITGGGIHPVAKKIAELTGGEAVDAFKNPVKNEDMCCVVINCGGSARTGLFPKNGIQTINILSGGPNGLYASFCREDNYVSGVVDTCVSLADEEEADAAAAEIAAAMEDAKAAVEETAEEPVTKETPEKTKKTMQDYIAVIGTFIAKMVGGFFNGGKTAVDTLLHTIVPFLLFISIIQALMTYTGIGTWIANTVSPLAGNIVGLIVIALICGLPFISPMLGPGAVFQQILGGVLGTLIAQGAVPVTLALPAFFAQNICDICDFIPVACSLGEADPETTRLAVPSLLYVRFATAPVAVLVGYLFSIGLYR